MNTENKATTAVAKKDTRAMLMDPNSSWGKEIAKMLPDKDKVATFMACALNQFANPKTGAKLLACTPASIYHCVMTCARMGVTPDGVNAYLIPYGNQCTLQMSFRGWCDFLIREGIVKKFDSDIVRSNDIFKWRNGELDTHEWGGIDEDDRGEVKGCWVCATLGNDAKMYCFMSKKEVEHVRSKSQSPNTTWAEWWGEMAKKSVLKRLIKMLPNTPRSTLLEQEDNKEFNLNKEIDHTARVTAANLLGGARSDNPQVTETIDIPTADAEPEKVPAEVVK